MKWKIVFPIWLTPHPKFFSTNFFQSVFILNMPCIALFSIFFQNLVQLFKLLLHMHFLRIFHVHPGNETSWYLLVITPLIFLTQPSADRLVGNVQDSIDWVRKRKNKFRWSQETRNRILYWCVLGGSWQAYLSVKKLLK